MVLPVEIEFLRAAGPAAYARVCGLDAGGLPRFIGLFWREAGEQGEFIPNWHSEAICQAFTLATFRGIEYGKPEVDRVPSVLPELVINTPPGSSKTLITEVFGPAWVWTWDPGHRFICATFDDTLAYNVARKFLRLVQSEIYRTCFPHVRLMRSRSAICEIENTLGGCRYAVQLGGGITGRHCETLIGDDLIKPADARAGLVGPQLDSAWETWQGTFRTRKMPGAATIMIAQRLAAGDPPERMLDAGAEHVCITAQYVPGCSWDCGCPSLGPYDPRSVPGESFCSERFPDADLAARRRDMPSEYEAQYQQNATPAKGAFFEEGWFHTWVDKPPVWECEIVQSWDLGFDGTRNPEAASRVHGALWARYKNRYLLLDEVIGVVNYPGTKRLFCSAQARSGWERSGAILIEAKANGPALLAELQEDVELMRAIHGIPVLPVEPRGSKEDRARRHSAKAESGQIWLPTADVLPSVAEFRSELGKFPKQKHNDRVDTTTQALDRLAAHGGQWDAWVRAAENL